MYCLKGHCTTQCEECKKDFKGMDHWDHCEDPLNCKCEEFIYFQVCNGYDFTSVDRSGTINYCNCEDGLIYISGLKLTETN